MAAQAAKQATKAAPAVTVKPKGPQVVVRAKRKADAVEESNGQPDKKQHHDDSNGAAAATTGGLAGLASYSSSGSEG